MANSFLTTLDNPYNPWTHWDDWYNYDLQKGYDCCGLLARVAPSSVDSLPEEYTDSLKEIAIDNLIDLHPNIYTKISENTSDEDFKKLYADNIKRFKAFADLNKQTS